jgi:hypothetical protein
MTRYGLAPLFTGGISCASIAPRSDINPTIDAAIQNLVNIAALLLEVLF